MATATATTVTGHTIDFSRDSLNRIAEHMSYQDPSTITDMLHVLVSRSYNQAQLDAALTQLADAVAIVVAHQRREEALAETGRGDELAAYRADMAQRYGIGVRNA